MIRILTVIGARPQIIKAAAIHRVIKEKYKGKMEEVILHTGQHYDDNMSDFFFKELGLSPAKINLAVGSGNHGKQTALMIQGIEEALLSLKPDAILVYGDTNSTVAAALAGSKLHVPIIHVEAGLRSFDKAMPEEINRIMTDHSSTLLFSPTQTGVDNLVKEGFDLNRNAHNANNPGVYHVGDVMYDNSIYYANIADDKSTILEDWSLAKNEFILATVHRDNNTDSVERLLAIVNAFDKITKDRNIKIVWPIHPRTSNLLKKESYQSVKSVLDNNDNLLLIPPASFFDIIVLEKNAKMILTDSGGVQKEAYFFNKPCVILRPHTEWVELVASGHAILCDANFDKIIDGVEQLLSKDLEGFPPVFGNAHAAEDICRIIYETLA